MKRALIQFDEDTYEQLRTRAFQRKQSIAAVVRELVGKELQAGPQGKYGRIEDFSFIGAGSTRQGGSAPVSERHDEAWASTIYEEMIAKRSRPKARKK